MSGKLQWFKFVPKDWISDHNLSRCSVAARGFWMDVLCLAFDCEERGVLASNGKAWSKKDVAASVRGTPSVNLNLLHELIRMGVARVREDGAIYSLRLIKDEQARLLGVQNGQKGGNPALLVDRSLREGDNQSLYSLPLGSDPLNPQLPSKGGSGGETAFVAGVVKFSPDAPAWFPFWAARHARTFGFRKEDDPQVFADWWVILEDFSPTEDEMTEATDYMASQEKQPKGRSSHPPAIRSRILAERKLRPVRPAAEQAERITPEKWEELKKATKGMGFVPGDA